MTLEEIEKEVNEFKARVKSEFEAMRKDFDAQTARIQELEKKISEPKPEPEEKKHGKGWW